MSIMENGALLKVNGEFVNKNTDLFMDCSDTGYLCEKAIYFDKYANKNTEIGIDGNFYVYAGDENFMLCFYKGYFYVITHNKVILSAAYSPFLSETFYFDNLPSVTVERLDKSVRYEKRFLPDDATLCKVYHTMGKKQLRQYIRILRKKQRRTMEMVRCTRWKAAWDYNGKHYEVIFGFGIDNREEVWNEVKLDSFDFSETEIKIIDAWFSNPPSVCP